MIDINLEPVVGHEQGGSIRPALVVQADELNEGAWCTIVVPITKQQHNVRVSPIVVEVQPPEAGLIERSFLLCHQIRAVDKRRIISVRGTVTAATLRKVTLGVMLATGCRLTDEDAKEAVASLNFPRS